MSDYNQFVLAVNKIFEITAKIKAGWRDQDNINIADSIEESKNAVVEASKLFNTKVTPSSPPKTDSSIESNIEIEDEEDMAEAMEDFDE